LQPGAGGEVVLAGFYKEDLRFAYAPAFMREARIRIAAQWSPGDLVAATELVQNGKLDLDGLITHTETPENAQAAYTTAFTDPNCLKMVLAWRP
jgi:3-hydroxyethyl bacteriochlorophyllide a dehydrogenase